MTSLTLSAMEGYVLQDLFDTGNARWQTTDIDRALDRAVDRYSAYYPNIVIHRYADGALSTHLSLSNFWNAAYPVHWIERILLPVTNLRLTIRSSNQRTVSYASIR